MKNTNDLTQCKTLLDQVQLTIHLYNRLRKISKALQRSYTNSCNFTLSKRQQAREDKLQREAEMLAEQLGLKAYHQTDPRGCALYLGDADINEQNYNHGIAIY